MSLGLPSHLVQPTLSRALARGSHVFGMVCLAGATLGIAVLAVDLPNEFLWLTFNSLLAMAALLVLLSRVRTVVTTLAFLLVGALSVYLYTFTVLGLPDLFPASNMFIVALPKMALIMVGGAGSRAVSGALWSTAGFVLAEAATVVAVMQTGVAFKPDLFTLSVFLLLVAVMFLDGFARRTGRAAQPALHRAVQDDASQLVRHDLGIRAIARLHDTTVTQLVALSRQTPGEISEIDRHAIGQTLLTLENRNWLLDDASEAGTAQASTTASDPADAASTAAITAPAPQSPSERAVAHEAGLDAAAALPVAAPGTVRSGRTARNSTVSPADADVWLQSSVYTSVEHCRDRGLVVEITGERAALGRLHPQVERELGLAVQQCLVNVLLHSGILAAEVAIDSDQDSVSVMVKDAGRGFTEADSGSDRLGLRQAVRRRIERQGGDVSVWSRPGAGTSVLLSVPVTVPATLSAATGAAARSRSGKLPPAAQPPATQPPTTQLPTAQAPHEQPPAAWSTPGAQA